MILVKENLSFIRKAETDHSKMGQVKYHVAGRISLLGTSLLLVAESVTRAAVACLSFLTYLMTVGMWSKAKDFAETEMNQAKIAGSVSGDSFLSVFSPKSFEERVLKSPMGGIVREFRVRKGAELIQDKLDKEFLHAQNQMVQEQDGPFQYLEGNLESFPSQIEPPHGERETIGGFDVGVCQYIGRKESMEDEHLAKSFTLRVAGKDYPVQLFGIFDGHGGPEASKYVKENLQGKLEKLLVELNPNGLTDEGIWNALKLTFVQLNQEFKEKSGTTATVALILDGKLWTANVGDSRTILDNNGQTIQLSEDAKPGDERYDKGIQNRGGSILWNWGPRVNGILAVARSIGDHILKGAVSARPKITAMLTRNILPGSHLVLTCDGVYDVASSRQVGAAVHTHRGDAVDTVARNLVFSAHQANSLDNLSAMVIRFP